MRPIRAGDHSGGLHRGGGGRYAKLCGADHHEGLLLALVPEPLEQLLAHHQWRVVGMRGEQSQMAVKCGCGLSGKRRGRACDGRCTSSTS
eukprot:scaffold2019_cov316-Prasinococcus_capsulatus_cf.AAC.6